MECTRSTDAKKGASPPPPIADCSYPLFATKARDAVNLLMIDAGGFKSLSDSAPLTMKDLIAGRYDRDDADWLASQFIITAFIDVCVFVCYSICLIFYLLVLFCLAGCAVALVSGRAAVIR